MKYLYSPRDHLFLSLPGFELTAKFQSLRNFRYTVVDKFRIKCYCKMIPNEVVKRRSKESKNILIINWKSINFRSSAPIKICIINKYV